MSNKPSVEVFVLWEKVKNEFRYHLNDLAYSSAPKESIHLALSRSKPGISCHYFNEISHFRYGMWVLLFLFVTLCLSHRQYICRCSTLLGPLIYRKWTDVAVLHGYLSLSVAWMKTNKFFFFV